MTGTTFGVTAEEQDPEMQWNATMIECIDLEKIIGEEILEVCEGKLRAMTDQFTL